MVLEQIVNRYSVRKFKPEMPTDDAISNILEAGRLAPSWMNVQPWKFIIVKNPKTKELLSKLSHGQPHVFEAPVIIACCGDFSCWEDEKFRKFILSKPGITQEIAHRFITGKGYNPSLKGKEAVIARTMEEVAYATAYMTIEAYNQGLGACVIGAIGNEITESLPEVYAVVKEELGLDENTCLLNFLAVGYPESNIKPAKTRKSYSEVVFEEKIK